VNVTRSARAVERALMDGIAAGDAWGRAEASGRRVMVEYGNPNPFKEMHIGHAMSAIVGEAIARLEEAGGATLIRDTFGGDVGPHVAKALWALRRGGVTDVASPKEIGAAYIHGSNAYEESEEAKAEIDALNTRIYEVVAAADAPESLDDDGRALLSLWRKGREVSMEEFERVFAQLGTKHDYVFYDSDTTKGGLDAVADGLEKGIFEESEGAVIYPGEKRGLFTLVFVTSRGTPTYETKDVGLAFLKEERVATDENIIVTAVEQVSHFKIVLAALEDLAPALAKKTTHVAHGLLRLTTGKMSSRKGNIITAAELIKGLTETAMEKNPDPLIAQAVAVGAVKYMVLRQAPGQDIVFDAQKSLSLDGDSGPYLQYALVRARSVLAKAPAPVSVEARPDQGPDEPYELARLVVRFPEIAAKAARERAPQQLAQYLTQLAGEWNAFYAREKIIGGEHEAHKLVLARAFAEAMRLGLGLLAIPIPERM
jgi:arginyl-tRNA synthetase